eukprot:753397-Hanusia_phi.AAC.2
MASPRRKFSCHNQQSSESRPTPAANVSSSLSFSIHHHHQHLRFLLSLIRILSQYFLTAGA